MGLLLKIAIFAVVAYGVWTTVRRWYGVLGGDATKKAPPPAEREAPRRPAVEETRLCSSCGSYVSVSAAKCGRPDCPQPA